MVRLARNTRELLNFVGTFRAKGVNLLPLPEAIVTASPPNAFYAT